MWCRNCQQDIPAIGSADDAVVRCARCRKPVGDEEAASESATINSGAPSKLGRKTDMKTDWLEQALSEDWELEDELNEAQQLAASLGADKAVDSTVRFDRAHLPRESREPIQIHSRRAKATRHEPASNSFFSWCMLSLGLMAFVFGAVLIGWSFAQERPDLLQLGLPFTLGGQAALIVGLVFQLDGLWRSNRQSMETLDELDSQLDELRHATSLLSTTHSNSAQSFYLHMADGASPNLLLADLKGQLDLLAGRLADQR